MVKPTFSGKFHLRMPPDLHGKLSREAADRSAAEHRYVSMNTLIVEILTEATKGK